MPLADLRSTWSARSARSPTDKGLGFNDARRPEDLPGAVRTDEKRLQQIVLNLLSNAFKFTAEGSVTLTATQCRGEERQPSGAEGGEGARAAHRSPSPTPASASRRTSRS